MKITQDDIAKLCLKLIEVFRHSGPRDSNFNAYWRLEGPLQTFCESAVSPLEQEVAKMLLAALETRIRCYAHRRSHPDAEPAASFLREVIVFHPPRRRKL